MYVCHLCGNFWWFSIPILWDVTHWCVESSLQGVTFLGIFYAVAPICRTMDHIRLHMADLVKLWNYGSVYVWWLVWCTVLLCSSIAWHAHFPLCCWILWWSCVRVLRWQLCPTSGRPTILRLRHIILLVWLPSCWKLCNYWWTGVSGKRDFFK